MTDHKLYEKILDITIALRDVHDLFRPSSAQDIKKLIASKMKAKKKEPKALDQLYILEKMITELRETFVVAKDEYTAERPEKMLMELTETFVTAKDEQTAENHIIE